MMSSATVGEFVDFAGDRYFAIRNVDKIDPFFISVISDVDHWLFVSSNGGLTAGRVSPDTALFPYTTVDKIHDSAPHTGCKTIFRVLRGNTLQEWEPFNREHDDRYSLSRNLYKNLLGNKLCFEETNHDLQLAFRYTWATSGSYGFVRQCELQNLGDESVGVDMVDGLQNILPANTPRFTQTNTSNLVDAYKWSELDKPTGLAILTLYSGISDRAEPCESLKATTVFCLGLEGHKVLISSDQLGDFHLGAKLEQETHKRGVRSAYFVNKSLELAPQASQRWQIVADTERTQSEVVTLCHDLGNRVEVGEAITRSIDSGSDALARIMASGDGFQATAEESVTVHHYANVLFNILRGGVFDDQYRISARDFTATIRHFNRAVYERNRELLENLPEKLLFDELLATSRENGDRQLQRLTYEYLPITFGRRHGDPSRPWNQFAIRVKDRHGNGLLSYQGNWRDIFQNWEALLFSYPGYIENVIAKGIDWEVEEPDDPWSYIGYWGDHQIIYLQKFLELSRDFHPDRLPRLLRRPIYCYANVPYRISPFEALLEDPKKTVSFDESLAARIEERVTAVGADGKLVLGSDGDGEIYQVNLLEKLLVPLLSKLGNLVIDGGIWMNTQRPEWNDANNALVGQGLSMVTLYYMRRYVRFLQDLLAGETESFALSTEVSQWLADTKQALGNVRPLLSKEPITAEQRYQSLTELGQAASRYRETIYQRESFSGVVNQPINDVVTMLDDALATIDHSIGTNKRKDGLYHAYNLLDQQQSGVEFDTLYPMLEGQVAALSAGAIGPDEAVTVLEALFESDLYRPDQKSFMLYPDRILPGFLARNRLQAEQVEAIPLLLQMLAAGDEQIILRDADGCYRFSADFKNAGDLEVRLGILANDYGDEIEAARQAILELYETVFQHKSFTGRSGTMFEQGASKATCQRLGQLYYRIRGGIGFNKTPGEYGAFPTDPYSHTPKHSGAKQPGMTGQVKEEILCRFGELGIRVSDGEVNFRPELLRAREFMARSRDTGFVDVDGNWQTIAVPVAGLAFTWCQVPIIYRLDDDAEPSLTIIHDDGTELQFSQLALPAEQSSELFRRSGRIRQILMTFKTSRLFVE